MLNVFNYLKNNFMATCAHNPTSDYPIRSCWCFGWTCEASGASRECCLRCPGDGGTLCYSLSWSCSDRGQVCSADVVSAKLWTPERVILRPL